MLFPSGSGRISVSYNGALNSTHWRDLSFITGVPNRGNAVTLVMPAFEWSAYVAQSDFVRVTLGGADRGTAGGSDYWNNAIFDQGISNIIFDANLHSSRHEWIGATHSIEQSIQHADRNRNLH
jgi:hypothetical protein